MADKSERRSDELAVDFVGVDLDLAMRIEAVCRRFEADRLTGARHSIESYLAEVPDEARPVPQAELEALERELR
jgi:hypothetical protein